MLEEIHLAGSARPPFGRYCSAFADISAVELCKGRWSDPACKPEDVKEPHVENILGSVLHPIAARQMVPERDGRK